MDILDFVKKVSKLKDIERSGWLLFGVKKPESVADHSFSLAILAYVYSKKLGLNPEKCIKLALIHDLCEVYTGDIITRAREEDQKVNNRTKDLLENKAMEKLLPDLPENTRKEMESLWREFREGKTREAVLVRDLDRLEPCIQALEYEKAGRNKESLEEFFTVSLNSIKTPEILEVLKKMFREHKKIKSK